MKKVLIRYNDGHVEILSYHSLDMLFIDLEDYNSTHDGLKIIEFL